MMKGENVLWRVGRRRGFALIAAMGVLAALFILIVAGDTMGFLSARAQKTGQRAREAADLGECAARLAATKGAAAGERSFQVDGVDCTVRLEPLTAANEIYKDTALAFRQGDQKAEIQAAPSGREIRASYLVNSSVTPARAILLEQKTGQSQ